MARDLYQEITDWFVQMVESGEATGGNWMKPWAAAAGEGLPSNVSSGNDYHGINVLRLWFSAVERGYELNLWGTYRQWQQRGCQVRKGERGEWVVFYKTLTPDERDDSVPKNEKRRIPMMRYSTVFNAEQVDGWSREELAAHLPELPETADWTTDPWMDDYLEAIGVSIENRGARAYYNRDTDGIVLPEMRRFKKPGDYYPVAFHELTHWSGAPSRLNRAEVLGGRFGDAAYAMEELVAEIGAAFQSGRFGLEPMARPDHAEYVAHWLEVLKRDNKAIGNAAARAADATEYLSMLASGEREGVPA